MNIKKPIKIKQKKCEQKPRTIRIAISVNEDEKKTLCQRAKSCGIRLSRYVYLTSLRYTIKRENPKLYNDITGLLKIGNNINQLARVANRTQQIELSNELAECIALIRKYLSKP